MHPKRLKDINQSDFFFFLQFNVLVLNSCRHRRIHVCTVNEYLTTSTQMYVFGMTQVILKQLHFFFRYLIILFAISSLQ